MDIFPKATRSERTRLGVRPAPDALSGTGVLLRRDRQGDPVVIMQEPRSNAMRVGELACQLVDHTRLSPRIDLAPGAAARTSAARFPSRPSRTKKSWQDAATPHLTLASRKADCAARYRRELWTRPQQFDRPQRIHEHLLAFVLSTCNTARNGMAGPGPCSR